MESTWKANTNYYTIIDIEQLEEELGEELISIMKYKTRNDGESWKLKHVVKSPKFLEGNKVAISIQITNATYADYKMSDGTYQNVQAVRNHIDIEDFDLAKYMFEKEEFLNQEEYDELEEI